MRVSLKLGFEIFLFVERSLIGQCDRVREAGKRTEKIGKIC